MIQGFVLVKKSAVTVIILCIFVRRVCDFDIKFTSYPTGLKIVTTKCITFKALAIGFLLAYVMPTNISNEAVAELLVLFHALVTQRASVIRNDPVIHAS